ncbi:MAG: DNA polymerase IV [Candidatus Bathyarchaeota archaeon]|nr:DNA polymerase IV [Candidatus Bathyarchaeota archaeon]
MRIILHIDLDYFFAQVEENLNPSLKNKIVVVCVFSGRTKDSGVVSTSNYEAREYGIESGMPIYLAKKILKDKRAVFLPVNHSLYEEISHHIMELLRNFADNFEQVSIDEAYLEITKRVEGKFEEALKLAKLIKESVFEKEGLTCSIGIGSNKLLAKIGSDLNKPNGLTLIKPSEVKDVLSDLTTEKLPGVGRKYKKLLDNEGIKTIGELAAFNVNNLKLLLGKKIGERIHRASLGLDDEPVKEELPKQFSRIITLKEDSNNFDYISNSLNELCGDIWSTTRNEGFNFKSVGLIVVTDDLKLRTKSKTLSHPMVNKKDIIRITKELLKELLEEGTNLKIRRIGVKTHNLVKDLNQRSIDSYL